MEQIELERAKSTLHDDAAVVSLDKELSIIDEVPNLGLMQTTYESENRSDCHEINELELEYLCGICKKQYIESEQTENEVWIECESCFIWYHLKCVNIASEDLIPDVFFCPNFKTADNGSEMVDNDQLTR